MHRPNDPDAANPLQGDEFADDRGESQRHGSKDVFGVAPNLGPVQIGIAPPDPMVVVSNFDTRPIGAYDFSFSGNGLIDNGESGIPTLKLNFAVPDGYTAVLRRVRFEVNPPVVVNTASTFNEDLHMDIKLLRDGGVIPNNVVVIRGSFADYEWLTHQVFGMRQTFGVFLNAPQGIAVPNVDSGATVTVTMQGTLIPSKSRPPEVEIASDPVLVRVFDPKQPRTE